MPLTGEYEPSAFDHARDQVDLYERSGGTEGTAHPTGERVIVLTSVGAKSGKLRKSPLMRVEHNGERLAEYGPGALLGERAHLEGGKRTSTLVAVTPCRVASVEAEALDRSALVELSKDHRREEAVRG